MLCSCAGGAVCTGINMHQARPPGTTTQHRMTHTCIQTLPLLLLPRPCRPFVFEGIDTIEIKGSSLMPQRVVDEIVKSCLPPNPYRVDIGLMDKVREKIEKW